MLEETWRRYKDRGLVVLGVDFHDLKGAARRFARENDMSYPLAYDGPGATITDYGVEAAPETFFVAPDGKLVCERLLGGVHIERNRDRYDDCVQELLDGVRFLLVVVAALALAGPAAAACPTLADLEGEVMCPECKTTLDQSDAPVARDIKRFIETRAAACVSEEPDQGRARRAVRPGGSGGAAARRLPLAGVAPAARGPARAAPS